MLASQREAGKRLKHAYSYNLYRVEGFNLPAPRRVRTPKKKDGDMYVLPGNARLSPPSLRLIWLPSRLPDHRPAGCSANLTAPSTKHKQNALLPSSYNVTIHGRLYGRRTPRVLCHGQVARLIVPGPLCGVRLFNQQLLRDRTYNSRLTWPIQMHGSRPASLGAA